MRLMLVEAWKPNVVLCGARHLNYCLGLLRLPVLLKLSVFDTGAGGTVTLWYCQADR